MMDLNLKNIELFQIDSHNEEGSLDCEQPTQSWIVEDPSPFVFQFTSRPSQPVQLVEVQKVVCSLESLNILKTIRANPL